MGFFVFTNFFTLRVNLSVAIIAMVNSTYLRELEVAATTNVSSNSSSGLFDQQHAVLFAADNTSSKHHTDNDDNVRIWRSMTP